MMMTKVMLMMVIMVMMMMLMMLMAMIIRLVEWSSPFGIVQSIVFDQMIISRANVIGITIQLIAVAMVAVILPAISLSLFFVSAIFLSLWNERPSYRC